MENDKMNKFKDERISIIVFAYTYIVYQPNRPRYEHNNTYTINLGRICKMRNLDKGFEFWQPSVNHITAEMLLSNNLHFLSTFVISLIIIAIISSIDWSLISLQIHVALWPIHFFCADPAPFIVLGIHWEQNFITTVQSEQSVF